MFIDEHGNIVFETIESRMISLSEFQQTFGMALQFYLDDILDNLDKIFKINWLCDKDENKIKLISQFMDKFKLGDKVKIIHNQSCSINRIGDIGNITDVGGIYAYKVTAVSI